MLIQNRQALNNMLKSTAAELDIPDHVYEDATIKYVEVGEYLGADDSALSDYSPEIYVQGSFRLGTIVRPKNHDGEYDIDQVCRLTIKKQKNTQSELKQMIGDRLKEREDLRRVLKESRRCWTLKYPKEPSMPAFHLDVLPSIPNEERPPSGILLSDKELRLWQKSNPSAYADWFKDRMRVVFQKKAEVVAESMAAKVEDVPEWRIKTPLQRSVQILKRHRDMYFASNSDEKPVSIIITTLAGKAYQNEEDLFEALTFIVERMPNFIENRKGVWWVQNPVDDGENFADKWNEYPERRHAFESWLEKVKYDFTEVARSSSLREGVEILSESMGKSTMSSVASNLAIEGSSMLPALISATPNVPSLADTSHALDPKSNFQIAKIPGYKVSVVGSVHLKERGKKLWPLGKRPVPRSVWLRFSVHSNVPEPYTVKWQVTNSGDEAIADGQPRGDFYKSEDLRKRVRWESTAYRGTHWVKAFVFNAEGVCVAESSKTFVKIR